MYPCILLIWIIKIFTHCESASKENRNSADQICAQYGGLVSYQFFLDDKSCKQYRSYDVKLSDGESAWVAENVNYSKFVSWQGCYSSLSGFSKPTNNSTKQTINMCLSLCKDKQYTQFIGFETNFCRCMSETDIENSLEKSSCGDMANHTVMPGSANLTMSNSNPYGDSKHAYKIHEHGSLALDPPFDQSFGQCVYMEKIINESNHYTLKYNTKSCYSKDEMKVNGLVCVSKQPFANDTCTPFRVDSKYYCVKNSTSNWLQANQECQAMNGNLFSNVTAITEEMVSNMQINIRYWTGIFRDFVLVSELPDRPDTQVCLSVRNNGNRLVLEPGDCSEEKQVLCNQPFGNYDNTNHLKSTTKFHKSSYMGPVVIVSLTFNGVLLSIIAIGAVIFRRKTRRTRHRKKIEKRKSEEERAKTTYDHVDLKTNTLPKDGVYPNIKCKVRNELSAPINETPT